jgi:hypothetical protein
LFNKPYHEEKDERRVNMVEVLYILI